LMRWEKEKSLPIHRIPGGQRRAVYAYREELDEWLLRRGESDEDAAPVTGAEQNPTSSDDGGNGAPIEQSAVARPQKHWRYWAWGAAAVLMLVVIAASSRTFLGIRRSQPARASFTADSLQVWDAEDHLLWTHKFPGQLVVDPTDNSKVASVRVTDLDGDGKREVLIFAQWSIDPNMREETHSEVEAFSSRGEMLWSYVPHESLHFGEYEYGDPWGIMDLFVAQTGGKAKIWVTASHEVWGVSLISELDPVTGKATLRFVNTGVVRQLREIHSAEGTFLLAAGFNNESDSASLMVVNESTRFAASSQTSGSRHECRDCPPGRPDYYFEFPKSEIAITEGIHEDSARFLYLLGNTLNVETAEMARGEDPVSILYQFQMEPAFHFAARRFASGYDDKHVAMEKEGKLKHTLGHCPERLHPQPVRMWTPAAGWTEIAIPARGANQ